MFNHEKQLFHPVGVERQILSTQHCCKNSSAAQTAK